MTIEWSRELDLKLANAVQKFCGTSVWRSDKSRQLSWEAIFANEEWPTGMRVTALKERWQENHRKWVPRDPPKRAVVVEFDALIRVIKERSYTRRRGTALPSQQGHAPIRFVESGLPCFVEGATTPQVRCCFFLDLSLNNR